MAALTRPALAPLALALALSSPVAALAADGPETLEDEGSATDRYLSSAEILGVLHSHNSELYDCFRAHVRRGTDPGELTLLFVVDGLGRTTRARLERGDGFDELARCLEETASDFSYPSHDGLPLEVAYPLVFRSDLESGTRLLDYPLVFLRQEPPRLPLLTLPPTLDEGEVLLLERLLWPEPTAP